MTETILPYGGGAVLAVTRHDFSTDKQALGQDMVVRHLDGQGMVRKAEQTYFYDLQGAAYPIFSGPLPAAATGSPAAVELAPRSAPNLGQAQSAWRSGG